MEGFSEKAENGDEDFKDLMMEMKSRDDLRELL